MKRNSITIGLTGSLASGKSTALTAFRKCGCITISADEIAHSLIPAKQRAELAKTVFKNANERRKLEKSIHPKIIRTIKQMVKSAREGSIIVVEAPLLFETGFGGDFDFTVFIDAPKSVRLKRYKRNDFSLREKAQWSPEKKRRLADIIIDNSSGKANLSKSILQLLRGLNLLR